MPREIATDILSQAPIDVPTQQLLARDYQASPDYLRQNIGFQQRLITTDLDRLQEMVSMSRPEDMDPVVGYHAEPETPSTEFGKEYDVIRRDPVQKMTFDNQQVHDFMRKLGPTNPLVGRDKLDAGFDIANLRQLLKNDFHNLPEADRKPELRMTEALLNEELALLWTPLGLSRAAQQPHGLKDVVANPADVNLFGQAELDQMDDKDRWKLVGASLAEDAAGLFRIIAASESADNGVKLEALVRSTDMQVRALRLRAGVSALTKSQKQELEDEALRCSDDTARELYDAWIKGDRNIPKGKLFEFLVVSSEREKLRTGKDKNHLIRLALPREDEIHPDVPVLASRMKKGINLSADVIVEDANGNFVIGYQAKALDDAGLRRREAARVADGRNEREYALGRISLRQPDDYQRFIK